MSSPIAPAALKRQMFEQVYTELRDELVEYVARQGMPGDATEWFSKVRLSIHCYLIYAYHRVCRRA